MGVNLGAFRISARRRPVLYTHAVGKTKNEPRNGRNSEMSMTTQGNRPPQPVNETRVTGGRVFDPPIPVHTAEGTMPTIEGYGPLQQTKLLSLLERTITF